MRTPKIGDIVHFNESLGIIRPAIVLDVWENNDVYLKIFSDEEDEIGQFHYGPQLNEDDEYWSWPEEEKQCEHEYDGILKLFCGKCGHRKEEKPTVKDCLTVQSKAEELIDKILQILEEGDSKDRENKSYAYTTIAVDDVLTLIKEYKGTK